LRQKRIETQEIMETARMETQKIMETHEIIETERRKHRR
jgi:hypothetical protein